MWVNQHRHAGGVWILNPSGRTGSAQRWSCSFECSAAPGLGGCGCGWGFCLRGWKHPVRVLTARKGDGQWSGERESHVHTVGADPVAKARVGHRECFSTAAACFSTPAERQQVYQHALIFKEMDSIRLADERRQSCLYPQNQGSTGSLKDDISDQGAGNWLRSERIPPPRPNSPLNSIQHRIKHI